jgi:transcriptional regulator with XRE-family HTH domain
MADNKPQPHPAVSRFARRLRRAREAKGLSLSVVAQTVGTSQQYLSMVEREERDPDFSLVAQLAVLFDLDLPAIVYGQKVAGHLDDAEVSHDYAA